MQEDTDPATLSPAYANAVLVLDIHLSGGLDAAATMLPTGFGAPEAYT